MEMSNPNGSSRSILGAPFFACDQEQIDAAVRDGHTRFVHRTLMTGFRHRTWRIAMFKPLPETINVVLVCFWKKTTDAHGRRTLTRSPVA